MEEITKATIINCSGQFREKIRHINNNIKNGSFLVNHSYLVLGYTGMQDGIALVSEYGQVFELPYDENCISVNTSF